MKIYLACAYLDSSETSYSTVCEKPFPTMAEATAHLDTVYAHVKYIKELE